MIRRRLQRSVVGVLAFLCAAGVVAAQDLEPRAYSPNPTGANFVVLGYARSTGDIVMDPSLPIRDVEAGTHNALVSYGRTFAFFGRSANAAVALPYVWGKFEGQVQESVRRVTRSGLADLGMRVAVNLVGGPALSPREFARRAPAPALGVSLAVLAPVGQYYPDKLVNVGSNRWAFRPELGLSYPKGPWFFEVYGGLWMYTGNKDFYGGFRREQEPIAALQGHVVRTFQPRLWVAADATFYRGGRSSLDGVSKNDLQKNTRAGLTLALPAGSRFSAKVAWTTGFTTLSGGNFRTLSVALQYFWLD